MSLLIYVCIMQKTPRTKDVDWTYIRRSEDAHDFCWTSDVRLIYILCPGATANCISMKVNWLVSIFWFWFKKQFLHLTLRKIPAILSNFLVRKFSVNGQFQQIFGQISRKSAGTLSIHDKLGRKACILRGIKYWCELKKVA